MLRQMAFLFIFAALALPLFSQDSGSKDKSLDIRSSAGDLHMGGDADAKKAGLPLYPGARLKSGDENNNQANLSIFTEAFGVKLVVANYVSDDDKDSDKSSGKSKELKCDEDSGPVTELKVGTEDNQHIVAVEPEDGKGTHFALVYVHTRGKQGEI